jgi:lipoate---protein ligase
MKLFDHTCPSPAENLAADEALLDWCEENGGEEILRFWESPEYFVVVGYANKVATEVNISNCKAKQIPIFRRCSGGGTVLQGAGCLNYALILRIAENFSLASISHANQFIMGKNCESIQTLFPNSQLLTPNSKISICGHTDLTIGHLKFSGNSQRRRKHFLLFHGTFLLGFDLALVEQFLKMPSKQPDYRQTRSHKDFLTNLNASAIEVKNTLKKIWSANEALRDFPKLEIKKLADEKYSRDEWNLKF